MRSRLPRECALSARFWYLSGSCWSRRVRSLWKILKPFQPTRMPGLRCGNGQMRLSPPPSTCPVPPPRPQPWVCLTLPVRMMPRFVPPHFWQPTPICMCLPRTLAITKTPSPGLCLSATPRICQSLPAPIRRRSRSLCPKIERALPKTVRVRSWNCSNSSLRAALTSHASNRAPPAGRWDPICSAWMQTGIFMRLECAMPCAACTA